MFSAEGFHQSSAVRERERREEGGRRERGGREEGERREGGGREEGERREGGGREEGGRRERGGREEGGREGGGRKCVMLADVMVALSKFCVLETLSHDLLHVAAPQMVYTTMYNSTVTSLELHEARLIGVFLYWMHLVILMHLAQKIYFCMAIFCTFSVAMVTYSHVYFSRSSEC